MRLAKEKRRRRAGVAQVEIRESEWMASICSQRDKAAWSPPCGKRSSSQQIIKCTVFTCFFYIVFTCFRTRDFGYYIYYIFPYL